jgi:DNA-binding transcriptional ArsR family regulator
MSSHVLEPSHRATLRATAHPTRNRILELLRERPSMTATECAGILHLTPKTCSYHLQTLASSGLIEEVATPGRNRPWRLVAADPILPAQVASAGAAGARKAVRRRREESLLDVAADAIPAAPPGWTDAVTVHKRVATMTVDELTAWYDEVERVTSRHVRKSSIPDGTPRLPVDLIFVGYPR